MAIVKPAEPRAGVTETPEGLRISIPTKKNWLLTLFLGIWLCGWIVGELTVPFAFASSDLPLAGKFFAALWLIFWTAGGLAAIYLFLWSLVGREQISISQSLLSIKREIFGFGKQFDYELVHVADLRISSIPYNPFDPRMALQFWGIGGGVMAFDHGAATVRFGAGLEESEAKSILETIHAGTRLGRAD